MLREAQDACKGLVEETRGPPTTAQAAAPANSGNWRPHAGATVDVAAQSGGERRAAPASITRSGTSSPSPADVQNHENSKMLLCEVTKFGGWFITQQNAWELRERTGQRGFIPIYVGCQIQEN